MNIADDKPPRILSSDLGSQSLAQLAVLINMNWPKPYFGAVPYIESMLQLQTIDDMYICDSAASIVSYFLANANTWKGEVARNVKKELKKRCDAYYKKAKAAR